MQVFIYETSFGSLKIRNLKNFELNIALVVLVLEKKNCRRESCAIKGTCAVAFRFFIAIYLRVDCLSRREISIVERVEAKGGVTVRRKKRMGKEEKRKEK